MMRIHSSQIIILVLTLAAAAALDEEYTAIAKKCCPAAAFQCCYDSIDFHLRLTCDAIPEGKLVEAIRCIQSERHGENDSKWAGVDHLGCCDAFQNDFTDPTGICYQSCKYAMNAPSLKSRAKLELIKQCREKNHLNKCFNQCRVKQNELTAQGLPVPKYQDMESDECARYKMKDDELYPVSQIMKF